MRPGSRRLHLHVHDVLVRGHQPVAHLNHGLEREIGLLQGNHDVLDAGFGIASLESLRQLVCILLDVIHAFNRAFEHTGKICRPGLSRRRRLAERRN